MGSEPVDQLAARSAEARTRLAATIDEIQERIDPRRIVNDAAQKAVGNSREALSAARDTARQHPLAIGAGVAAIGIALILRSRLSKARVDLGDNLGDYTDYDDGFGFGEVAPGADEDEEPKPRRRALAASHRVEENPIVSIILGLAAGAALGALFPTTAAERQALGSAGDRLGDAARRVADAIGKRD